MHQPRKLDSLHYRTSIDRVRAQFRTRTGHRVHMRLLQPSDANLLLDFFHRLSPESRRRRFHADVERVDAATLQEASVRLADVDNATQGGAVVAVVDEAHGPAIIGVARLARPLDSPDSPVAETAVTVRDDYHGQGLGMELLRRMVLLARKMNIKTIVAEIEADNEAAIRLFRRLNLPTECEVNHGEVVLRISVPE